MSDQFLLRVFSLSLFATRMREVFSEELINQIGGFYQPQKYTSLLRM